MPPKEESVYLQVASTLQSMLASLGELFLKSPHSESVVTVEQADLVEEPDPEVMAKRRVLLVRNLAPTVTEEMLEKSF